MRGSKVLSWVVLGALALGVVLMLSMVMYQQGVSAQEREQQHAEIVALQAGLEEANARLEAEGEAPVPVPTVGTDGEVTVVPIPPTQEQLDATHAAYCAIYGCRGKDGADAEPVTNAQVRDAVEACFATGACPVPRDGTNGADGVTPTAEDLAAIHNAYCAANNDCRGADGKDSTVPGPRGVGIQDMECHETGDWIITLTDGTALTANGPCRYVEPSPTPTPTASTTKGR